MSSVRQNTDFGAYVREQRQAKGLTLRELAKVIDIVPSYLSNIETGYMPPPSGGSRTKTVKFHFPPDLVVKFQPIDIVDIILWQTMRLSVVYTQEIKDRAALNR